MKNSTLALILALVLVICGVLSFWLLLPGETDGVMWAGFDQIHEMIRRKEICRVIAGQFLRQEAMLQRITQESQ